MDQLLCLVMLSEVRDCLVEKSSWPRQTPGDMADLAAPKEALVNTIM